NEPQLHYDPEGKNNRIFLNTTRVSDPIAWSMDYLRGNFASLIRIAGYSALAEQLDEAALTAALPTVEKALRDSIPADMQVLQTRALAFGVESPNTRTDRGPSLQVRGEVDGKRVQLLRFDCFEHEPHFHYDPEGKNNQLRMDKTKVSDPEIGRASCRE